MSLIIYNFIHRPGHIPFGRKHLVPSISLKLTNTHV